MTTSEETEIALLKHEMEELRNEVKELKASVSELVNAWQTANGLIKFIKFLAGFSISCGVLYELVKNRI